MIAVTDRAAAPKLCREISAHAHRDRLTYRPLPSRRIVAGTMRRASHDAGSPVAFTHVNNEGTSDIITTVLAKETRSKGGESESPVNATPRSLAQRK